VHLVGHLNMVFYVLYPTGWIALEAVQLLQHRMCSFGDVKRLWHSRLSTLAYINMLVQARVHTLSDGLSVHLSLALSCRT